LTAFPLLVELPRLEFLYERTGAEELTYVFKGDPRKAGHLMILST
jgi:hypothetical protein